MREDGTILATRVIVNPDLVGYPLTIIVEVSLENEHQTALEGIKQALINDPLLGNSNIRRFKTSVVMDRLKSTTVLPL